MYWIIVLLGFLFTIFSGSILAYISVATMMGPWIAPTIAVIASVFFKFMRRKNSVKEVALVQAIGSIGGAIATGIGFAFPMLFFLDPKSFARLLSSPISFCLFIAALCLGAGALGITLGNFISNDFIEKKALPFPVSQLTYSVIGAQSNRKQAFSIFGGVTMGTLFAFMRDGIGKLCGFMPKTVHLFSSYIGQELAIALWPTIWAIGFISGTKLIAPLIIGLFSKYLVLYPINNHALYLPFNVFQPMHIVSFVVAFCSGIAASEVVVTGYKVFRGFALKIRSGEGREGLPSGATWAADGTARIKSYINSFKKNTSSFFNILLIIGVLSGALCLLTWLKFPITAQIVFLALTILATYQICLIGGNIGLIHYGRFSAYVLVPMFLLFDLSALQLTVICTFFNICAATASDLLFDLKTGDLAYLPRKKMLNAQWVGLIGVALTIGIIFYLLFTNLPLGSPEFFAQRSQSKALLLQTLNFNFWVVFLGFLYGIIVKKFGLSPTMVFSGIIMPNSISIGLIIGASLTLLVKQKSDYLPFCAGVFTSESLWILAGIAIKL